MLLATVKNKSNNQHVTHTFECAFCFVAHTWHNPPRRPWEYKAIDDTLTTFNPSAK